MLDIRLIREKPDFVRERLATRGGGDEMKIDEVLRVDGERRKLETSLQQLNADRRRLSKEIGAKRSSGGATAELEARVREIGEAIVERRLSELQAKQQELGKVACPKERLYSFVSFWIEHREIMAQHGCPIGTFCSELNKEGGLLARKASKPFADLLTWAEAQFREFCSKGEARGRAIHLVSALQGAAVLANCAKDSDLIKMEAKRLVDWIRSL